ncbi:MAG: CoA transferase [Deltaproteobacteria bacterium]|nr:CoA transferase [Deltaproteobacteria bacterium]
MAGALNGTRILDFTHALGGPFCTMLLKDLGAEVIKIERPGSGDLARSRAPQTKAKEGGTFIMLNRGKKSLTLNLKSEEGLKICKELVKKVDVVVENFSTGTMDRLGLGSAELLKLNPALIYASLTAFGHTGPLRNEAGYDPVAQAMGGLTTLTGYPDSPPVKAGPPVADLGTGTFLALAIVSALNHRVRTGEGQVIDMSMQDAIWLFTAIEFAPNYFIEGTVPRRYGNGVPHATPANLYNAKDGHIIIATAELEQAKGVFRAIGREDLIDSPLCSGQAERIKYKDEIDALVGEWTGTRTMDEILESLKKEDVPCSMVPAYDRVCNDPQLLSREMIIDVEQPLSGRVKVPGSLFKLSRTPGNVSFPAPRLGENNYEILSDMLGYSEHEINRLGKEGII